MRRRPLVSVVVCTYARPEPLRAALVSICAQDVDGVEVVVVNDGGPDVAGVVAEFGDRFPVRLITLPTNKGLTAARRSGIGAARGQFVAFLDDDDLWLPDHLSVALGRSRQRGRPGVYDMPGRRPRASPRLRGTCFRRGTGSTSRFSTLRCST